MNTVGVVVGRFQTPELHEGHKYLLDTVREAHSNLLIFVGYTPGVKGTPQDPLDFPTRWKMLVECYPEAIILPLADNPSDEEWSRQLDRKIAEVWPDCAATLYGSRKSFIPHYSGGHPRKQLESKNESLSGTALREVAARTALDSYDFRAGVIYAHSSRWPIPWAVVDVAVVDAFNQRVLVGRKKHDPIGQYRFIGGFVDALLDDSLERAVFRELGEECPGVSIHAPVYLGSYSIQDWRYRKSSDKLLSAFFLAPYMSGRTDPASDLAETAWMDFEQLTQSNWFIVDHREMARVLCKKLDLGEPKDADNSA